MDRGAWWATVHGISKGWIQLSDQHFHLWVFQVALVVKNLPPNVEDIRDGNPLQYSCLGNPMDRGACQAVRGIFINPVHRVAKSCTQLK